MDNNKILIIGGVAGGASAAARLRRLDEKAEIIIFERGEFISFANCGLPYYIGDEIKEKSALTLQTPQSFKSRFNVDVRVFNEVISINTALQSIKIKNLKTNEIYDETYDKLILSMGAKPIIPPIDGIESKKIFTLRNIPDTYKIKNYINENKPKKVAVIGGGYIGIEMAENLFNLGLDVAIIEMSEQIIGPLDYDMSCEVRNYIRSKGINLILKNGVKSISDDGETLNILLQSGSLSVDFIILAIGVSPDSKIAQEAGLNVNKRGSIIVNNEMLTSNSNIYAVGDVIEVSDYITKEKSFIPLAGPANKQGRIAADNICGGTSKYKGTQGSSVLKVFELTIATTGMNEKLAKKLNYNYDKCITYSGNHAGYYPNAKFMSIKTIYDKNSGKILGAQLIGFEGTDKRCDVLATAIHFGATANDLTNLELCYAPPYSSAKDPVNMAGYVIENQIKGKSNSFHWHDIESLKNNDNILLIDLRTPQEFANGYIQGFINIPLNELRNRIHEIDKNKKIYVTCQIGLRGYIGERILKQYGFEVYNLNGGYRFYKTIFV